MVNGADVNLFNTEHLKIAEIILANENVNLLDQEFRIDIIEALKSIEHTCTKYRHNKAVYEQSSACGCVRWFSRGTPVSPHLSIGSSL